MSNLFPGHAKRIRVTVGEKWNVLLSKSEVLNSQRFCWDTDRQGRGTKRVCWPRLTGLWNIGGIYAKFWLVFCAHQNHIWISNTAYSLINLDEQDFPVGEKAIYIHYIGLWHLLSASMGTASGRWCPSRMTWWSHPQQHLNSLVKEELILSFFAAGLCWHWTAINPPFLNTKTLKLPRIVLETVNTRLPCANNAVDSRMPISTMCLWIWITRSFCVPVKLKFWTWSNQIKI